MRCCGGRGGTGLGALGPEVERGRRGVERSVLVTSSVVHVLLVSVDLAITGLVESDTEVLFGGSVARGFKVVLCEACSAALLVLRLAPAAWLADGP